jgi:hypothetical protein
VTLRPLFFAAIFFAINLYLWSLPISDEQLFLISLPLGIAYFWAIFRLYDTGNDRPPGNTDAN